MDKHWEYIDGYRIDYDFIGDDRVSYFFNGWDDGDRNRTAKIRYCKWATGLHGNAPSGTRYASFKAAFPDGKTRSIALYV